MIRNVFGNAETLSAQSSCGVGTASSARTVEMDAGKHNQITFSKPLFGDPTQKIDLGAYILYNNHTNLNSFCETLRGFNVGFLINYR
jgi:hypothetical protein